MYGDAELSGVRPGECSMESGPLGVEMSAPEARAFSRSSCSSASSSAHHLSNHLENPASASACLRTSVRESGGQRSSFNLSVGRHAPKDDEARGAASASGIGIAGPEARTLL